MKHFWVFLWLLFGTSCEDDMEGITPPDYRQQWVGFYIGQRTISSWGLGGNSSLSAADTVLVVLHNDSSLLIDQTEIEINEQGYGEIYTGPGNFYQCHFYATDSLEIETRSGGLGGGVSTDFLGASE